jgi:hypothetical protein
VRQLETLTSETFQSARRLLSKTMIAQNYHARNKTFKLGYHWYNTRYNGVTS